MQIKQKYIDRFWSKVNKTNACWEWTAARWNKYGAYGYRLDGTMDTKFIKMPAHRFSYLIHYHDPGKLLVRHNCDNTLCVRPDHLALGTHKDNMQDMTSRNRSAKGIDNAAHVLTEDQVKEIKSIVKCGRGGNVKALSLKYKVSNVTILQIAKNIRWKHV